MSCPGDALLTAAKARAPVATARSNAGTPARRIPQSCQGDALDVRSGSPLLADDGRSRHRLRSLQSLVETGVDKLTVPPHTGEPAARAAMDQAAQAGNRTRTPALLAAIATAAIPGRPPAGTPAGTPDSIELSTWEWEGGKDGARSQRAATSAAI
jgi:hypothetical protein